MGEMDGLNVTGFAGKKDLPNKAVDPQCKAIMEQVDSGLKANPGNDFALIGQPFKTKDEVKKKAKYLNSQIPLMGGDLGRYKAESRGTEETGYQLCCSLRKPAKKGKAGKGKSKQKGAKNVAKNPSHEQYIADMKKMLETPEKKAELERIAKAAGYNTPEEYIAKIEAKASDK